MCDDLEYGKPVLRNRIRQFREECGWTQSDLAWTVGCSKNAISCFERGEFCPSARMAACLCAVFSCSFEELFYLDFS